MPSHLAPFTPFPSACRGGENKRLTRGAFMDHTKLVKEYLARTKQLQQVARLLRELDNLDKKSGTVLRGRPRKEARRDG